MDDSPNHSATMVAMILLGFVFITVAIALLIYRYYRRTSGPVWITKVFRFITCSRCFTFGDVQRQSHLYMAGPAQQDFECGCSSVSEVFCFVFFFGGGGGGGAEACYPGKIGVLITLRYRKVDL